MTTDKKLSIAFLSLALVFGSLVIKKVFFKKQKMTHIQMASSKIKTPVSPYKAKTQREVSAVSQTKTNTKKKVTQTVIQENSPQTEIDQAAHRVLAKNDSYCMKQENCPVDLGQLYAYIIDTIPYQGNEAKLIEFQKKIRALEIPVEQRQALFADLVIKSGDHFSDTASLETRAGRNIITMQSVLMFSTLTNYLGQKPDPQAALDVITRSLARSPDRLLNKITQNLLIKAYPRYNLQIRSYLANSGLVGLGG